MTNRTSALDAATMLLNGASPIPSPVVEPLRSEVRSGERFLIGNSEAAANFIGNLVVEWGYEVHPDHVSRFRQFLIDHELTLHQECPDGVFYKGTYAVWTQSNMLLGGYRTVWAFNELADMAKLSVEAAGDKVFGRLLKQLTAFRDASIGASRSQQMYQPAHSTHVA
jgi:hypothetical protein